MKKPWAPCAVVGVCALPSIMACACPRYVQGLRSRPGRQCATRRRLAIQRAIDQGKQRLMGPIVALSIVVGLVFWTFVFGKLVVKHTKRITSYEDERHFFLKFFDVPAFVIMAVMMTGGIAIRSLGLAPEVFIAVFYTGLGSALTCAGIRFGWMWMQARRTLA